MKLETVTEKEELERRLIYSVIVAGKSADFARGATERFLPAGVAPLDYLRDLVKEPGAVHEAITKSRTGNYNKLGGFILDFVSSSIDLASCSPADLESLHGVGPKTARFFILWTRPEYRCAALDVHVLRWLRNNGYPSAPQSSPQSRKTYSRWEAIFLSEADKRNMTARELDYQIWSAANIGGIR